MGKIKEFFNIDAQSPERWWRAIKKRSRKILSKLEPRTRYVYIVLAIICFFALPILVGVAYMFSLFVNGKYTLMTALGQNIFRYLLIGWTYAIGWTLLSYLIVFAIIVLSIISRSDDLSMVDYVDEETNTAYAKKEYAIYGNKRFADEEEAAQCFDVGRVEDAQGIILGAFDQEGEKVVSIPTNNRMGNLNCITVGSPGSGKSSCLAQNLIMQAQKRNESIVCIDTKGELAAIHYRSLENDGYRVWLYNVKDPKRSHGWNFCSEVYDPLTGRLDDSRLDTVVNTIMENTVIGSREDPFFRSGTVTLLKSILAYFAWKYEQNLARNINQAADQLEQLTYSNLTEEQVKGIFSIIREPTSDSCTLKDKEEALRTLVQASGLLDEEAEKNYINDIKEASEPLTIERVVAFLVQYTLSEMAELITMSGIPASHPAYTAWTIANKGGENITPSFITGLANRLSLFLNQDIAAMCAVDDIDLRSIGTQKTALFVVVSDNDSSKKALTSLFFTFLFKDLADAADEVGAANRIPVNVIEDEFPNIGKVQDFERTIATSRSRKIYLFIIIQSLSQLRKVYSEDDMNTILECCDTTICLGLNGSEDNMTAKYIQSICGVTSKVSTSTSDRKNIFGLRENPGQGYGSSQGVQRTYLITEDELIDLDPSLMIVKSSLCKNPLKINKFLWVKHPTAWSIEGTNVPDYIDPDSIPEPRPDKLFPPYQWPTTQSMYGVHNNLLEGVTTTTASLVATLNQQIGKQLKKVDKDQKGIAAQMINQQLPIREGKSVNPLEKDTPEEPILVVDEPETEEMITQEDLPTEEIVTTEEPEIFVPSEDETEDIVEPVQDLPKEPEKPKNTFENTFKKPKNTSKNPYLKEKQEPKQEKEAKKEPPALDTSFVD